MGVVDGEADGVLEPEFMLEPLLLGVLLSLEVSLASVAGLAEGLDDAPDVELVPLVLPVPVDDEPLELELGVEMLSRLDDPLGAAVLGLALGWPTDGEDGVVTELLESELPELELPEPIVALPEPLDGEDDDDCAIARPGTAAITTASAIPVNL